MIDVSVLRLLLLTITGWLDRREREALAYLIEENRLTKAWSPQSRSAILSGVPSNADIVILSNTASLGPGVSSGMI